MQPQIHTRTLTELRRDLPSDRPLWVVDISRQRLMVETAPGILEAVPVSTSLHGVGNEPGSEKTPLGLHRVAEVIGRGAALGQPFKSRKPVGDPLSVWTQGTGDAILTRILWLDGMIPGLNHHSHQRYIYIHGTHQEERLGTPASGGCIRMANRTLADWADCLTDPLPYVWIGTIEEPPLPSLSH